MHLYKETWCVLCCEGREGKHQTIVLSGGIGYARETINCVIFCNKLSSVNQIQVYSTFCLEGQVCRGHMKCFITKLLNSVFDILKYFLYWIIIKIPFLMRSLTYHVTFLRSITNFLILFFILKLWNPKYIHLTKIELSHFAMIY